MELRHLRYFLEVAEQGNMTRAAASLHITQPTLSRQIAALERELDVDLFAYAGHRLRLTDEGRLLLRRAREVFELIDKTQDEIAHTTGELEGTISIGCGDLGAMSVLVDAMAAFRTQHPLVSFDTHIATADHIIQRMEQGLTDIGLLLDPVDVDRFEFIRTGMEERWVVAMKPDDLLAAHARITPLDLEGKRVIIPPRDSVKSAVLSWFENSDVEPVICGMSNLSSLSASLSMANIGYAITIEGSLANWDKNLIVCRPLNPPIASSSVIAWRRGRAFGTATTHFIQSLRTRLTPSTAKKHPNQND